MSNGTWWENTPTNIAEIEQYALVFEPVGMIVALFSVLVSGTVILTMCVFPSMLSNKSFNQMVLLIAVGDFTWSLACTFGFPDSGTALCGWQGALLLFGIRVSWTWACFMLVQLDGLVYTGALRLSPALMHGVCWPLNIALQCVVPMLDIKYGVAPFFSGLTICTTEFAGEVDTWRASVYAAFIIPMFTTIIFMTVMFVKIYVGLQNRLLTAEINRLLIRRASMYPATVLFSWLPIVVTTTLMVNTGHEDGFFTVISYAPFQICIIFATGAGGAAFGLLYFFYFPEATLRWRRLFKQWKRDMNKAASKGDIDSDSAHLMQQQIEEDFKTDASIVSSIARDEDIEKEILSRSLSKSANRGSEFGSVLSVDTSASVSVSDSSTTVSKEVGRTRSN